MLDELLEIMFDDLELPELEKKALKKVVSDDARKRKGKRLAGIRPRLDKKSTARNRIRRKLAVSRSRDSNRLSPQAPVSSEKETDNLNQERLT